jgi:flagellar biosynthesis/type III secretory pathway protein FliH
LSDSPVDARPARWLHHAVLGGSQQTTQFVPSWAHGGPREFIESFLNEPGAPDCFESTEVDAPAAAAEDEAAGEPGPAPEAFVPEAWEAQADLPPLDEAQAPQQAESEPLQSLADPAPQPLAHAQALVDEEMLARERESGYESGYEAGLAAARSQMRQEIESERAELKGLVAAIHSSISDARTFFAPMERLAVHLAEQLVRGELTLSGQAIRRLVENCLMELEHRGEKLVLRLNPEDMDNFSSLQGELSDKVELVRDSGMSRGSVRIEMADGVVEDLIEHRLEALAKSVLVPESGAQFTREAGAQRASRQPGRTAAAGADTDSYSEPDSYSDPESTLVIPAADVFRDEAYRGDRAR